MASTAGTGEGGHIQAMLSALQQPLVQVPYHYLKARTSHRAGWLVCRAGGMYIPGTLGAHQELLCSVVLETETSMHVSGSNTPTKEIYSITVNTHNLLLVHSQGIVIEINEQKESWGLEPAHRSLPRCS